MARLDFTAGNILLATELDELARQSTSNVTAASKPSATAEGETIAVTDNDRLNHWDGAAWQRGTNWASGGRTWVTKTENGAGATSLGTGSVGEIAWTGGTDPDSFYTGGGSPYTFTVPSGLGGIYIMTVRIRWAGAWTTNPEDRLRITLGGSTIFDYHQGGFGANYIATLMYPIAAATTVSIQLEQNSGSSQTISSGDFTMVRLCI
jgi:hypothetical protein